MGERIRPQRRGGRGEGRRENHRAAVRLRAGSSVSTRRRKLLVALLACVLAVLVAGAALFPWMSRQQRYADVRRCTTNLRVIGQGVYMYANANGGTFPDTIDKLITTQGMVAEHFVCPHAPDTPAPGATAQAQAANLSKGGHLSYLYVGKGMSTAQPPPDLAGKTVLAYEPLTNHDGSGANFVFADGHVEWMDAPRAQAFIGELAAEHNPPRPEMIPK